MGYNIEIVESTAYIPKANLDIAYRKMCALNTTHHELKQGWSWGNGKKVSSWFSWMDSNYPETCSDTQAILHQLGFDTTYNIDGDLVIIDYDSKMGQEDLFLDTISHLAFGKIDWIGEDGSTWTTEFLGDSVIEGELGSILLEKSL